jgi:hypothetical protein
MRSAFTIRPLLTVACVLMPLGAHAQSVEQRIDGMQREIDRLRSEVSVLRAPSSAAASDTTLFGYGEFNYNRFRDDEHTSRADLRRFVFGFGHRFNERLSFMSEVELEHAVVSKDDEGEVEIEQAYLNYQLSDALNVKGGLFLIPLGILNETHEPPTYYGVERNEVETRIIPTTWRELGVGVHGLLGGAWRYDVGVTTGFNAGKLDDPSVGIRSAHQEGQLAAAHDLSVYGALNYRQPGLLVGGGLFTGDTGQNGQTNPLLTGVSARLTLWDIHAKYSVRGFDLQALYAAGRLGDAQRLNEVILASSPEPFATPRSLKGWYGQAAYHLWRKGDFDFAPFVRLERFEIRQQEDPANGLLQDPHNLERVRTIGFNFYVHPQVVIKSDIQRYSADRTRDRFNVGLGYMF